MKATYYETGRSGISEDKPVEEIKEDIRDLMRQGADISVKPLWPSFLREKIVKRAEYWKNSRGEQKIVLVTEDGYSVSVREVEHKHYYYFNLRRAE